MSSNKSNDKLLLNCKKTIENFKKIHSEMIQLDNSMDKDLKTIEDCKKRKEKDKVNIDNNKLLQKCIKQIITLEKKSNN